MAFQVEELHVFVEILDDGTETVVQTGNVNEKGTVTIMPLITAGEGVLGKLKGLAQMHADKTHRKVKHLKLTNREEIETIEEQLVKTP